MKKKFALLLIPMLLIPLASFAYAHFTDQVMKKYKIHVGSVFLNVTGFHVDAARMPDVNNNGEIFGDELNITIYEANDCRWYVEIEADPITGGFYLNTTLNMTNGGKLPFTLDWNVMWDGPYDEDPCYVVVPTKSGAPPSPPWSFEIKVYRIHDGVLSGPLAPTQVDYKPGDIIMVKQYVDFKQPEPTDTVDYQKVWQCKWIKIWVTFEAEDAYMDDESWSGNWP